MSGNLMYLSNTALESIDLSNCLLGMLGTKRISTVLKKNKILRELNLSGNQVRTQEAKFIADALKQNEVLKVLNLSNTELDTSGVEQILNVLLDFNKTLEEIDFSGCEVGDRIKYLITNVQRKNPKLRINLDFLDDDEEAIKVLADNMARKKYC